MADDNIHSKGLQLIKKKLNSEEEPKKASKHSLTSIHYQTSITSKAAEGQRE